MRTEAPELTLDIAYWAKWVTADEISKMNGINIPNKFLKNSP